MHIQPPPREPESAADQRAEDAQHYRQVLHGLIDMGADLARMVHQQAVAQAGAEAPPAAMAEAAGAFERIARTVRRTILLAQRVAEPAPATGDASGQHRVAARKRIIRAVEDAIQRRAGDAEAGRLQAEFLDRLDGPDLEDEIGQRPAAEIIADICRDLGLASEAGTHPWKRRTPADIIALCARAAAPASPAAVRGVLLAMPPRSRTGSDPPAGEPP